MISSQEKYREQRPRHSFGGRVTTSRWEMSEGIMWEVSREPDVKALKEEIDGAVVIGDSALSSRSAKKFKKMYP